MDSHQVYSFKEDSDLVWPAASRSSNTDVTAFRDSVPRFAVGREGFAGSG